MAKYGWKKDPHDPRDRIYMPISSLLSELPRRVDHRHMCSPVENQGQIGSCTANAIVGAIEHLDNLDGKYEELSRLALYYCEREEEGTVDEDAGAFIRDGVKISAKIGVGREALWPYNPDKFDTPPGWRYFRDAAKHKVKQYHRVLSHSDMLQCIAAGNTVIFGFSVYESFESEQVARTGLMPFPDVANEKCYGGHAVLAVGYDLDKQHWIVRNSWGTQWGDGGYFYMPFKVTQAKGMADDFWTITRNAFNT